MIIGIGTDLVDLDRFRAMLDRRSGLIERLFTPVEREYAERRRDPVERYAVRFAAKEATLKAMGVGLGAAEWHEIEVLRDDEGRPRLSLTGAAARLADSLGITRWELSLSHSDLVAMAVAVAVAEGDAVADGRVGDGRGDRLVSAPQMRRRPVPERRGPSWPVVTPAEMRRIDAEADEPVEQLIDRAGSAVARSAVRLMGGSYGRRVLVIAGPGNNGNDGRVAAERLRERGVRVEVVEPGHAPRELPAVDLVVDAAFGTGFRGRWSAPSSRPDVPVLAVDIPSGIDGLTGIAEGPVLIADHTVTFAAYKPGLLFGDGPECAGTVEVVDLGLPTEGSRMRVLGSAEAAQLLPQRRPSDHKWRHAVWVVAGGHGMEGAAVLSAAGAVRAGAGYVRLSTPGALVAGAPTEVVRVELPAQDWSARVIAELDRFGALVIGGGLGTDPATGGQIRAVLDAAARAGIGTVVDADALTALANTGIGVFPAGSRLVLTPHDGEFERLAGRPPGPDRPSAARELATATGTVVLLKGPTTVVASPDGDCILIREGDARLATAGTGDVLAGVVGALIASGLEPLLAAAEGAFIHGRAGALGWRSGLVAGDVARLLPVAIDDLLATPIRPR